MYSQVWIQNIYMRSSIFKMIWGICAIKEKSVNDDFPAGFFVLENTCIDAIVIACNEAGEVFFVQNSVCRKIADSISGYIELSLT